MLRVNHLSGFGRRAAGATPTNLIDVVGSAAKVAYGLRLLRAAYAGAGVRVRRASDNVEQDIGFSGEALDWAAAASFKGASSLLVKTWYDQSGNGSDWANGTSGQQPTLDTTNHEIDFDGTDDTLFTSGNVDLSGTDKAASFLVARTSSTSTQVIIEHGNNIGKNILIFLSSGTLVQVALDGGNNVDNLTGVGGGSFHLVTGIYDLGAASNDDIVQAYKDTVAGSTSANSDISGNFASQVLYCGTRGGSSFPFNGSMKEFVLFGSNVSAQRAVAEANINTFHTIY